MKALLCVCAAILLAGCTTVITPQGECRPFWASRPIHSVVNNTVYKLDVIQDGVTVMKNLGPGQVLPVPPRLFDGRSVVVVTAHTDDNRYIGAATHMFIWDLPDAWLLTYVESYAR